jgi:hypothetical protein
MTDRAVYKRVQVGQLEGNAVELTGTSDQTVSDAATRTYHAAPFNDSGNAAVNFGEEEVVRVPLAGKVLAAYVTPPAAITADALNYCNLTLAKRTAGGTATTVGTLNTATANIAALTPTAMTITANAIQLSAGDSLTIKGLKTGNGKAMGAANANCRIAIVFEEN